MSILAKKKLQQQTATHIVIYIKERRNTAQWNDQHHRRQGKYAVKMITDKVKWNTVFNNKPNKCTTYIDVYLLNYCVINNI